MRARIMAVNHPIEPTDVAGPVANYALAVLSEFPQRVMHTSGIVPIRPDGSVPSDIGEQAGVVWTTIGSLLSEAGMTATDVVSVVTYVVAGEDLGQVMAARDSFLGSHRAASTLVVVTSLAQSGWRMEVAVVAVA